MSESSAVDIPQPRDTRLQVISPPRRWLPLNIAELWQSRELIWALALRDIKVRYKQSLLGMSWAVIQPTTTMLVFWVLFGLLGNRPTTDDIPYPLIALSGLLPWQLFANSLNRSGNSLVDNAAMVKKIYFPRLALPLSPLIAGLVDLVVALLPLAALMLWYGVMPSWHIIFLPCFVVLAMISALAISLWLSAINVLWRDIRHIIPFIVQLGMFVTPVLYATPAVIPGRWRLFYAANPMWTAVEGFRWCVLPDYTWQIGLRGSISAAAAVMLFLVGLYFFRSMEQYFADRV